MHSKPVLSLVSNEFYLFEVFFVLFSKLYFGDQYNCWTVADLRYLFADALKPGAEYPPRLFSGQSFTPWTLKMESSAKMKAQCLKIIEKVALNIASEASYVYILKVDKSSLKMPKWSIMKLAVKQYFQKCQF